MRRKFSKIPVCFFLCSLLFCGSGLAQKRSEFRKLAFKDEFNKRANSPVDTSKWTAEIGGKGWGNEELQYYTDSIENAYHDGKGSLVIKAVKLVPPLKFECWYGACRYTSARLITKKKFAQKYGRFEARIKIPAGQGMWSAFWMLGSNIDEVGWANCGEIDIMENIGREPLTIHGTIHGPNYSGADGIGGAFNLPENQRFADDFHVYATEWTEKEIKFFVDGNLYKTITPNDIPKGKKWVYDHPFFMILNLAIGGNWGGKPDETSPFPGIMQIDYVRVYKK